MFVPAIVHALAVGSDAPVLPIEEQTNKYRSSGDNVGWVNVLPSNLHGCIPSNNNQRT
jgi:hypothetical protein